MIKIAPSILAADYLCFGKEVDKVEKAGADYIHIDVMDGHFVDNITFGPGIVRSIRKVTKLPIDVHLMIDDPEKQIERFAEAGANIISFHVESTPHADRVIREIKGAGVKAAVALSPSTPLNTLDWILEELDMVLLMTVNPGMGGQKYIAAMTDKIRTLRNIAIKKGIKLDIEVDGGITEENIFTVTEAGANVIVTGSTVYNAPDTVKIMTSLRQKAYGGLI